MKKVFFVGAIVCMAAAAFVGCKKNGGNGAVDVNEIIVCQCTDGDGNVSKGNAAECSQWIAAGEDCKVLGEE